MSDIDGKVIAITGAGSGIGRATSLRLARAGGKLLLGGHRQGPLEQLAEEIAQFGSEAEIAITDVCKRSDMESFVERACTQFGKLDVLVSNAGIGPISMIDQLCVDDWEAMIDVNFRGVLFGIAAALPVFRRQSSGHFVSVISTAGIRVAPGQAVYAATKNAVRTLHEGLRMEAGPKLRVTGVSPGFTRTNFAESISDPKIRATVEEGMKTMAIDPDAIARAIAFAIDQPPEVDVGDIVVRPTAQS